MKKTITAGLALLLLAGAAAPALAQGQRWNGPRGGPNQDDVRQQQQPQQQQQDNQGRGDGGRPDRDRPQVQAPPQAPAAQVAPQAPAAGGRGDRGRDNNGGRQGLQDGQHRGQDADRGGDRRGDGVRGNDGRGNGGRGDQGRGNDGRWNGGRQDDGRRGDDRRGDGRGWNGGGRSDWPDDRRGDRRGDRNWRPDRPVWQSPNRFRGPSYRAPSGFYSRSWGFGDILPRGWYGSDYRILDWWSFDLPQPPPGYDWIRVGSDAILVDRFDGRVVEVVRLLFW